MPSKYSLNNRKYIFNQLIKSAIDFDYDPEGITGFTSLYDASRAPAGINSSEQLEDLETELSEKDYSLRGGRSVHRIELVYQKAVQKLEKLKSRYSSYPQAELIFTEFLKNKNNNLKISLDDIKPVIQLTDDLSKFISNPRNAAALNLSEYEVQELQERLSNLLP